MSIKFEIMQQPAEEGFVVWAIKLTRGEPGPDEAGGNYYVLFKHAEDATDEAIMSEAEPAFSAVVESAAAHWGIEL